MYSNYLENSSKKLILINQSKENQVFTYTEMAIINYLKNKMV